MVDKSKISFKPVADPVWVHPLISPITYGPNEITEIAIRKPNGRDLLYYGSPVIADPTSDREARLDFATVYKLVSALSDIPEKTLQQAEVADMVDLGWKIGSFFIPGWQDLLPALTKAKVLSSSQDEQPVD